MGATSDRPTVHPTFDVEQYARDSDSRVATAPAVPDEDEVPSRDTPTSEVRLATRRPITGSVPTDETWARGFEGAPVVVVMTPDALRRMPLDHRAGYLMSQMDGTTDLETLVAIGPMPREEALRIVRDLYECGVVDFKA